MDLDCGLHISSVWNPLLDATETDCLTNQSIILTCFNWTCIITVTPPSLLYSIIFLMTNAEMSRFWFWWLCNIACSISELWYHHVAMSLYNVILYCGWLSIPLQKFCALNQWHRQMAISNTFRLQAFQMLGVVWSSRVTAITGWWGVVSSPALPVGSGRQKLPHVKASRSKNSLTILCTVCWMLTRVDYRHTSILHAWGGRATCMIWVPPILSLDFQRVRQSILMYDGTYLLSDFTPL